jgi:hypothetical protein
MAEFTACPRNTVTAVVDCNGLKNEKAPQALSTHCEAVTSREQRCAKGSHTILKMAANQGV